MRPGLCNQPQQSGHGLGGRRAQALLLVGAALVLFNAGATAQGRVSANECCIPLLIPLGARAVSLGQALTARTSIDGLFFNPASLANSPGGQFVAHHETTFEGQNNAFTVLVDAGLAGTFALTYVLIDSGEGEQTDGSGQVIGTFNIRNQQLVASYATGVTNVLRAGVSYKLFNAGIFCSGTCSDATSGTTHLLDLGIQVRPPMLRSLELGASILHFGFALQQKNAEQADPTPGRIRLGAAYELGHHFRSDSSVTVWISADMVNRLRSPTTPVGSIGIEVAFDQIIFLRAGFGGSGDALANGAAGVGVGIRYQRFTIGVSKAFSLSDFDAGGDRFQVSFGIRF